MTLDKESFSVLRYIYRNNIVTYGELKARFSDKPIFNLISALSLENAITYESISGRAPSGQYGQFLYDEAKIACTTAGSKFVEDYLEKQKEKRVESIRYNITTAIAVVALILAGISLAAQLGLIQFPKP